MRREKRAKRATIDAPTPKREAWNGMDVRVEVYWPRRVPPRCEASNDVLIDLTEGPTPAERRAGKATRAVRLTSKDVRRFGVCLDCNLALRLHPFARRHTSHRVLCEVARDRAVRL